MTQERTCYVCLGYFSHYPGDQSRLVCSACLTDDDGLEEGRIFGLGLMSSLQDRCYICLNMKARGELRSDRIRICPSCRDQHIPALPETPVTGESPLRAFHNLAAEQELIRSIGDALSEEFEKMRPRHPLNPPPIPVV